MRASFALPSSTVCLALLLNACASSARSPSAAVGIDSSAPSTTAPEAAKDEGAAPTWGQASTPPPWEDGVLALREGDPQRALEIWRSRPRPFDSFDASAPICSETGSAASATSTQARSEDCAPPQLSPNGYRHLAERRAARTDVLGGDGTEPPIESSPDELSIEAVGDVLMGMGWPEERARLPEDPATIFEGAKPHLGKADITFGNLETVLADGGDSTKCPTRSNRCYAFRVPTSYADVLKEVGFDVMSIANNHTGDFGEEGRASTAATLDAKGILHSGPIGDIASWTVKDIKVGLIAFSTGGGVHAVQDIPAAEELIRDLAKTHDIVIASFHGGAEGTKAAHVPKSGPEIFYGENRGELRKFTRALVDAGADLVLGHGPHLWRGMEVYKDRLLVYSMGNFSAWHNLSLKSALAYTGVLNVKLGVDGSLRSLKLEPMLIHSPGIPRPDAKKRTLDWVRRLSKEDFGDPLLDDEGRYEHEPNKPHTPEPNA